MLQQAEVAELNRRAQHAEQESSVARAETAAVRQAAAQQQAERAIAQYAQANRLTGLPFQDAQPGREYDPLPGLGLSRYGLYGFNMTPHLCIPVREHDLSAEHSLHNSDFHVSCVLLVTMTLL